MVKTLESLNRNLQTISSQVTSLAERKAHSENEIQTTWDAKEYEKIRAASEALHQALRKACTKHTNHTACLSLNTRPARDAQVQFTLAYTHVALSRAHTSRSSQTEGVAWFDVDFVTAGGTTSNGESMKSEPDDPPVDMTRTSKRQRSPSLLQTPKKPRNQTPSVSGIRTPPSSGSSVGSGSPHHALNGDELYTRRNFCNRIRQSIEPASQDVNSPLGLLDQSKDWKQIVYPSSKKPGCQPAVSLAEFFSRLS